MPLSGAGVYTAPASTWKPAVGATTISSVDWNSLLADLSTALSTALYKDGQQTVTANLPMAGFILTGLGTGLAARTSSVRTGDAQDGTATFVAAGGTVDAITATFVPAITAVVDGMLLGVRASGANATTTPTFSPNGLTARTIVKQGGQALVAGDIRAANHDLLLRYRAGATVWELLNPVISAFVASGSITASGYTQTTARLLGRTTAATGAIEEISVSGTGLSFAAGALASVPASDTVAGDIEIAIQSEMETGTDTTRAVVPGRQHFHPSAAKVWCHVSVAGGTPTLDSPSYNCSSVTDTGAGQVTVNYTTAFSSTTYAAIAGSNATGSNFARANTLATTSVLVETVNSTTGALSDNVGFSYSAFGDQ